MRYWRIIETRKTLLKCIYCTSITLQKGSITFFFLTMQVDEKVNIILGSLNTQISGKNLCKVSVLNTIRQVSFIGL